MRMTLNLGVALLAIALPASQASAERIFGLTQDNRIVTFDSATPGVTLSSGTISGIAAGDTLSGLDLRASNRTLYSVGTSGSLYAITPNATGRNFTATKVGGSLLVAPSGNAFGIDFNPTVDRLRHVSDTNQNLRINPNDPSIVGPPAGTINDTAITLNGSATVDLIGVAYTNNRPGVITSTVLYGIDAATDSLVRATNANLGTYVNTNVAGVVFGGLGFDLPVTTQYGFDISGATGAAFVNLGDNFASISLMTGAGTLIGTIGAGSLTGLTAGAVPEPASWALMIGGFGLVGVAARRRVRAVAA